jgi:hypothetical protein
MQKDHGIAIAMQRADAPCAQDCPIAGGDGNLCQHRMIARGNGLSLRLRLRRQHAPPRMQRPFRDDNAENDAEEEPDSDNYHAPTEKNAHQSHRFQDTKSGYTPFPVQA